VPGLVTDTQYEADGQTSSISYANGVSTAFAYSPERRWLNVIETRGPVDASGSGPLLQSLAYSRDDLGRISGVASNRARESWSYGYDTLDQLILADNLTDNALDQSFTYAANGNMLSNSVLGSFTYPPFNAPRPHAALTAGANYSSSYDENGNMIADTTRTFTWDGENRLIAATWSGLGSAYSYAPDGTRLKKVPSAAIMRFR
jgi:hypothetical protein